MKTKHAIIGLGSLLLLLIAMFSMGTAFEVNTKGLTDMAASYIKKSGFQLVAQNPSAQKALDIYNIVSNPKGYVSDLAMQEVCKEEKGICDAMSKYSQFSNFNDPTALMQQAACTENQEACSSYSNLLTQFSKVKNPWDTAQSYAMSEAVKGVDPEMAKKINTLMTVKSYLGKAFVSEEKPAAASSAAQASESWTGEIADPVQQVLESNEENFASAEPEEVTSTISEQVQKDYRGKCIVSFSFDETYGDIMDCVTIIGADRKPQDLSPFLGLKAGTLLTGANCKVVKKGDAMTIATINEDNKLSPCFITVNGNTYTNLLGGSAMLDEETGIASANFKVDSEGKLTHAEFKVAKAATKYVFETKGVQKQYLLPKDAVALYDNGELKIGLLDVKTKQLDLFSMTDGKWVKLATLTQTGLLPVNVKIADDGRYIINGKFRLDGDVKDIFVGASSDATINGLNIRTTTENVRFTTCGSAKAGENQWIDFCKSGRNNDYYAKGNGYAFRESIRNGYYYYAKGGEALLRITETTNGKYKRIGFLNGNFMATNDETYYGQHNGIFSADIPMTIDAMEGKRENIRQTLGSLADKDEMWFALDENANGVTIDMLKGAHKLGENADVIESTMVYEDAGVATRKTDTGSCVVPLSDTVSRITGKAISDVTGMAEYDWMSQEERAKKLQQQMEAERFGSASCDAPGEIKINSPDTGKMGVVVELKGFFSKDLYINGNEVNEDSMFFDDNKKLIVMKAGRIFYYANPNNDNLYVRKGSEVVPVAVLSSDQKEFIESANDEVETAVKAFLAQKDGNIALPTSELIPGRAYLTESLSSSEAIAGDWKFVRRMQGWQCTELEAGRACPSSATYFWVKCSEGSTVQASGERISRQFFVPLEDGCPAGTKMISGL